MSLLLLLSLFILVIFVIIFRIYWTFVRPHKRLYNEFRRQGIRGEPFVPLVGQLREMYRAVENDAAMDYHIGLVQKHGHIYLVGFGPFIHLVVNEPGMIADIFARTNAHNYRKPPEIQSFFKPLIGTQNLLVSEGMDHDRARKMLNPAFHFVKLQSMVSIMIDQTMKAIDQLISASNQEKFVDLQAEINELTLTMIASSAFGQGFETTANAKQIVRRAFTQVLAAMKYRDMLMIDELPLLKHLPLWQKTILENGARELWNFVDQIIADRRRGLSFSQCDGEDILDLLLSAVDTQGHGFTDKEIREQVMTFVAAGHETTGNLMTWTMYVLMTNDDVLRACQEEVDRVLPNGTQLTYEHLNELVVCEAVLQETLRLYPSVPFLGRQSICEHYIGSQGQRQVRVPAGAKLLVNTYALHRRADFWPRPLRFDYTRWLRDPITGLKPKLTHPFCYLPFGAGTRNCIGQNFALFEAKVILALLVQRCQFEMEPGQRIVPDVGVTLSLKYGLRAKISKRLKLLDSYEEETKS